MRLQAPSITSTTLAEQESSSSSDSLSLISLEGEEKTLQVDGYSDSVARYDGAWRPGSRRTGLER